MTMTFQHVALVGRTHMKQHSSFIKKLHKKLLDYGCEVTWDVHLKPVLGNKHEHSAGHLLKTADLVITLGGDGTILKLLRDLPKRKDLYVFGVNLGTLGFHVEAQSKSKAFELLDEFFNNNYHVDERQILRASLYRNGKKVETHLALNDVVINQGRFARLISLRAEVDQRKMIQFKADGLIIATPSGSTGHSLSAGGPILHPRVDGVIFTPICPVELSVRPIVIPSNRQITIRIDTERKYKDNQIGLTIDGQIVTPVEYGDEIKIRRSSRKVRFIRKVQVGGNYYKLLRDKLSWGKRA